MLSLHTNAASLSTQNSLASTNKALGSSMTKLGTGFRVNSAMDDAAGLQIANRLNAQARGMSVAQKNTQNGISMLQTGEGALTEINNIVMRMKDLATESANATASVNDRTAMQAEFSELAKEMANIVGNTKFAGENLFAASAATANSAAGTFGGASSTAALKFQIGSDQAETMDLEMQTDIQSMLTSLSSASANFMSATAAPTTTGEIATQTSANTMIATLDTALANIGKVQSKFGAAANRLEHTYNNLGNMIQNTQAAKGRIMDVDYATETSNMTSKQMLMQASTSMLKQSNSMSQMVSSLLQ